MRHVPHDFILIQPIKILIFLVVASLGSYSNDNTINQRPDWLNKQKIIVLHVRRALQHKGGFPLSRNFYVRTDVNLNWLYVRKLK